MTFYLMMAFPFFLFSFLLFFFFSQPKQLNLCIWEGKKLSLFFKKKFSVPICQAAMLSSYFYGAPHLFVFSLIYIASLRCLSSLWCINASFSLLSKAFLTSSLLIQVGRNFFFLTWELWTFYILFTKATPLIPCLVASEVLSPCSWELCGLSGAPPDPTFHIRNLGDHQ